MWPITTTEGARVNVACPKPWELRIPRTAFSGPQQMGEVKTKHLGGESGIKYTNFMWVLVLRGSSAAPGQCYGGHLAAEMPLNCSIQTTNFLPLHHFSIHLDELSQYAEGAVCSYETLKPSSQNEHN